MRKVIAGVMMSLDGVMQAPGGYVRAGEVKTGSFATRAPSKDELQRRERLKKEG
jgi:hypothetical protein